MQQETKFPQFINVFMVGPKAQESFGITHKFKQGEPVMCLEAKSQFELDNLLPGVKENYLDPKADAVYRVLVQDFEAKVKQAA